MAFGLSASRMVKNAELGTSALLGGFGLEKSVGNRRHKRIKMVLPVRISGKDSANNPINELAHTLDITPNGARLGAIHHALKMGQQN